MNTKRVRFPHEVKRGSSTVKIYRDRKAGSTYFRVCYTLNKKRHRLHFSDFDKAKAEAEAKASELSRNEDGAMQITVDDRYAYSRAREALLPTGKTVDAAAVEYSEAWKQLDGISILDAAKFYSRHHGKGIKRKPVAEAVEALIEDKKKGGASAVYLNDLRYRLRVFAKQFQCDLVSLTAEDVQRFFDSLTLSPRSFNNFLNMLRTFFRFAQERKWLSKELNLLESVKRRRDTRSPVEIFTPEEIGALLEHASQELAPSLALAAFAGLRSEEVLRLEWNDLTRRPGFIEVAAHKAKTATRRLVPITDNLARWLVLTPSKEGSVWKDTKAMFFKVRLQAAADAEVTWKPNVLRHSFISYRLAELQNVNQVALEAGNSPKMIFRHYRELATPDQARTWFAIAPAAPKNLIRIRKNEAG